MESNTADQREIVLGQHVHGILYGGQDGIVVAIEGEQQPATVRPIFGSIGVMGGNAHFDIIWSDGAQSRMIPESLVRQSVQWRVLDKVATADEIAAAHASVVIRGAEDAAKQKEADEAYRRGREEAIAGHPHLIRLPEGSFGGGGKHAAKNVRIELKAAFPKVKFSVTSDYHAMSVKWIDGPTSSQVSAIADRYCNGGFDSMQDMTTYTPSAFTNLFGGARYISCKREVSDEQLTKAIDALFVRLRENLAGIEKPDVPTAKRSYTPIPFLGRMTVSEGMHAIAGAWDCLSGRYVEEPGRFSADWLLWDGDKPLCQPLG